MRIRTLLTTMLALGLLATAMGTALAQNPGHGPGSNPGSGGEGGADNANATAHRDAAQARRAELQAAREAWLASFHENRTAAIADYKAAINATRESFLENKTRVIDECEALRNETSGNETSQCIRDGLKPLIEEARAAHKEARETFLDRMKAARQAALEGFGKARAEAHARHGPPQEG